MHYILGWNVQPYGPIEASHRWLPPHVTNFEGTLAIVILVPSTEAQTLLSVTAAIETVSGKERKPEDIASRLIHEVQSEQKSSQSSERASVTNLSCRTFEKIYSTYRSFHNPSNPNDCLKHWKNPN